MKHLSDKVSVNIQIVFPRRANGNITPFSFREFCDVLNSRKRASAGSLDCVAYDMVKALSVSSKGSLLQVFNQQFSVCTIHMDWRRIRIVHISKRNSLLDDFRNFRPIASIFVFLKLLNMMVKSRLTAKVDNLGILPACSFAYRGRMSTTACWNEFLSRVSYLKSLGLRVVVTAIDISSAYNYLNVSNV